MNETHDGGVSVAAEQRAASLGDRLDKVIFEASSYTAEQFASALHTIAADLDGLADIIEDGIETKKGVGGGV